MRNSIKKGLNVGWLIERARFCIRERAFAEKWMSENKRHQHYGKYGDDLLQHLFNRSSETFPVQRARLRVTARERFIVATVIQWLGTNIGFAWLQEVLEIIGYKIVPIDEERRRYYYHPFEKDRDASAWQNIIAEQNRVVDVYTDPPYLKPHIVKKQLPKRKHWFRKYGVICVRCGFNRNTLSGGKSEPDCFANFQPKEMHYCPDCESRCFCLKGQGNSFYCIHCEEEE